VLLGHIGGGQSGTLERKGENRASDHSSGPTRRPIRPSIIVALSAWPLATSFRVSALIQIEKRLFFLLVCWRFPLPLPEKVGGEKLDD